MGTLINQIKVSTFVLLGCNISEHVSKHLLTVYVYIYFCYNLLLKVWFVCMLHIIITHIVSCLIITMHVTNPYRHQCGVWCLH